MKRYIKYSHRYRLAIACFAVAVAITITISAVAAAMPGALLSNVLAGSTLFFVPTIAGAALMMGLAYWFSAEGRRSTFFVVDEQNNF